MEQCEKASGHATVKKCGYGGSVGRVANWSMHAIKTPLKSEEQSGTQCPSLSIF